MNRFIDNLRNSVWIRKEAEKVKAEQSKQDHIKDMYTRNLLNRKENGETDDIPMALLNIHKRVPVKGSAETKVGTRRKAFLPDEEVKKKSSTDLVDKPKRKKNVNTTPKNKFKSKSPDGSSQNSIRESLSYNRSQSPDPRLRKYSDQRG